MQQVGLVCGGTRLKRDEEKDKVEVFFFCFHLPHLHYYSLAPCLLGPIIYLQYDKIISCFEKQCEKIKVLVLLSSAFNQILMEKCLKAQK